MEQHNLNFNILELLIEYYDIFSITSALSRRRLTTHKDTFLDSYISEIPSGVAHGTINRTQCIALNRCFGSSIVVRDVFCPDPIRKEEVDGYNRRINIPQGCNFITIGVHPDHVFTVIKIGSKWYSLSSWIGMANFNIIEIENMGRFLDCLSLLTIADNDMRSNERNMYFDTIRNTILFTQYPNPNNCVITHSPEYIVYDLAKKRITQGMKCDNSVETFYYGNNPYHPHSVTLNFDVYNESLIKSNLISSLIDFAFEGTSVRECLKNKYTEAFQIFGLLKVIDSTVLNALAIKIEELIDIAYDHEINIVVDVPQRKDYNCSLSRYVGKEIIKHKLPEELQHEIYGGGKNIINCHDAPYIFPQRDEYRNTEMYCIIESWYYALIANESPQWIYDIDTSGKYNIWVGDNLVYVWTHSHLPGKHNFANEVVLYIYENSDLFVIIIDSADVMTYINRYRFIRIGDGYVRLIRDYPLSIDRNDFRKCSLNNNVLNNHSANIDIFRKIIREVLFVTSGTGYRFELLYDIIYLYMCSARNSNEKIITLEELNRNYFADNSLAKDKLDFHSKNFSELLENINTV